MTLLVADPLPDAISERQACDVLDACRNSLRAARKRYFFCGPPSPYGVVSENGKNRTLRP